MHPLTLFLALLSISQPTFASVSVQTDDTPMGCSALVENFCDKLWAPENLGNIDIATPKGPTLHTVRLGRMPNETTYGYWLFGQVQLRNRMKLPPAFRKKLDGKNYFKKLTQALSHKPYHQMSEGEVDRVRILFTELENDWSDALDEAATDEVNARHPGFFRLTEEKVPSLISREYFKAKDEIEAAAYRALWQDHPGWQRVKRIFDGMKSVFIELIRAHPGVSAETRKEWEARLAAMTLMIPGSDPVRLSAADRRCAGFELNGYHLGDKNALVICGGYLMSEGGADPTRTMAHEMGHALGITRSELEAERGSKASRDFFALKELTCGGAAPNCARWKRWRSGFERDLSELKREAEQNPAFLACFTKHPPEKTPDEKTLEFIAREWVSSELETQARRDRFIRMIKPEETLRDGSRHPNPGYLNPCGLYYLSDDRAPFDPDFTLNTFFVNEYACARETTPELCTEKPERCLETAIEAARELELKLRIKQLHNAGPYSPVRELQREGYSEDIEEDLADSLGELALSRYLEREADVAGRRAVFLAAVAPLCDEPSLAKLYPAEALVQKKYYLDPHSEGIDRRRKLLTPPLRKALGCTKDFEVPLRECDWYSR